MKPNTVLLLLAAAVVVYLVLQNDRPASAAPLTNVPAGGNAPAGALDVINSGLGFINNIFDSFKPVAQTQPKSN